MQLDVPVKSLQLQNKTKRLTVYFLFVLRKRSLPAAKKKDSIRFDNIDCGHGSKACMSKEVKVCAMTLKKKKKLLLKHFKLYVLC